MVIDKPVKGYFHVDELRDIEVPGELSFSLKKGLRLDLMGAFRLPDENPGGERRWSTIHGESMNGRSLTLLDCRGIEAMRMPGRPSSVYSSRILTEGYRYIVPGRANIQSSVFRVSHLQPWLNRTGIKYKHIRETHGFSVSYDHPGEIVLHEGEHRRITIWHATNMPISNRPNILDAIKETPFINIQHTKPVSIEDAVNEMNVVRDLMSLLMVTPTIIEEARVYCVGPKDDHTRDLDVFFPQNSERPDENRTEHRYMMYPYDDLVDRVDGVFGKWFDQYNGLKHAITFYHDAYFSIDRHAYQKFLDYTFSFESIHNNLHPMKPMPPEAYDALCKKVVSSLSESELPTIRNLLAFGNKSTLNNHLRAALESIGLNDLLGNVAVKTIARKITKTRNSMVHNARYNVSETIVDSEIVNYNAVLRLLVTGTLLRSVGLLDTNVLNRINRVSHFRFVLEDFGKTLASVTAGSGR